MVPWHEQFLADARDFARLRVTYAYLTSFARHLLTTTATNLCIRNITSNTN